MRSDVVTREAVFNLLVGHVREVVPDLAAHQFSSTDSLKDLGANSIDRAEILVMTLDDLSLKVPLVEFAGAANLGELTDWIHAKARG
jgi:polyketide biosynthesis acyl carrier protein